MFWSNLDDFSGAGYHQSGPGEGKVDNQAWMTRFCNRNIPRQFRVQFLSFVVSVAENSFGRVLTTFLGPSPTGPLLDIYLSVGYLPICWISIYLLDVYLSVGCLSICWMSIYLLDIYLLHIYINISVRCLKIMEFFVVFCSKEQRFYQRILEISNSSFTKIQICDFFFKITRFTICFFVFLLFLTFSFQFSLFVLVKKFSKFLCYFILWIRNFVKDLWKIMERFSKK